MNVDQKIYVKALKRMMREQGLNLLQAQIKLQKAILDAMEAAAQEIVEEYGH